MIRVYMTLIPGFETREAWMSVMVCGAAGFASIMWYWRWKRKKGESPKIGSVVYKFCMGIFAGLVLLLTALGIGNLNLLP